MIVTNPGEGTQYKFILNVVGYLLSDFKLVITL